MSPEVATSSLPLFFIRPMLETSIWHWSGRDPMNELASKHDISVKQALTRHWPVVQSVGKYYVCDCFWTGKTWIHYALWVTSVKIRLQLCYILNVQGRQDSHTADRDAMSKRIGDVSRRLSSLWCVLHNVFALHSIEQGRCISQSLGWFLPWMVMQTYKRKDSFDPQLQHSGRRLHYGQSYRLFFF